MPNQQVLRFLLLWTWLALSSFSYGLETRCAGNAPTVNQTQIGSGNRAKFVVQVYNSCPTCPVINIHLKCGSFNQDLVNPRLLKVLAYDDCVINGGLPLSPLQKFSFTYSHPRKFPMYPTTWYFQCE